MTQWRGRSREINDDNEAFWTGGRDGRLMITRCGTAGYSHAPAGAALPVVLQRAGRAGRVSGRGRVYSFTINRQQWAPSLEVPYVIAIVELEEQPGLRLLRTSSAARSTGRDRMPVEVEFVQRGAAFLPVFHRPPER